MRLRPVRVCVLVACFVAASAAAATIELRALDVDGAPVADAVVAAYALDQRPAGDAADAVMDQRSRRFTPQVLVVQKGADVTFPNSDDVSHHVYSFSPSNRFEIFLAKGGAPRHVDFDRAGVVTLGCNLHDWMLGYVVVVDTPHFAVSDADGRAKIESVRAGNYRIEVWHSRTTDPRERLERKVEIANSDVWSWELHFEKAFLPARDQEPGLAGY